MGMSIRLSVVGALVGAFVAGCSGAAPAKTTTTAGAVHPHTHNPGDHNHAKGKMLMSSDGMYDALLTAHLSAKDGNELDIFIEDKDGPYALSVTTLTASVRENGRAVTFECAPANERPAGEPQDRCSHFVAKTPWLRVGEKLHVESALPIAGHPMTAIWRDFEARTYAHHEE